MKPTNTDRVSHLSELLRSMRPRLNEGVYVFLSVAANADNETLRPIATCREDEGLSVIVEESQIEGTGMHVLFRAAWITLTVNSDLHAVGLTAAVARALADKGVSCNVVAAANHDHLFVPVESADAAMAALKELQSGIDASV
ncbi:MAG TPA: ACT domain-containing protein [Pyrinomonadaceae bacterium]|nr:ACT domain-containing protein [Pyrinomonadaceae bacterium]